MVGWHHWLDRHEVVQAPRVGYGQGSLAWCRPRGCKELDTTERMNWTEWSSGFPYFLQFKFEFGDKEFMIWATVSSWSFFAEEAEVKWFYEDLQDLLELTPKKDVLFIIGDWNAKVGSQETPGITGKFGLGIWNKAGQRLIEFCQENTLVIANTLFQQHKRRLFTWTSPDGQHWNRSAPIIFFAAKDGEALYSQQKQDQELTVAQIMNSLLPNSDLNWRK